ncbi:MAG: M64 family metallopeptidase [bacterium]|nr:M64 family metallopeptidase [bacterium]
MVKFGKLVWLTALLLFPIRYAVGDNLNLAQVKAEVLILKLHYSKGLITEKGIRIAPGFIGQRLDCECKYDRYRAKIYSKESKVLHFVSIGDPSIVFYDYLSEEGELTGGIQKLDETDFVVRLPLFSNMAKIEVLSPKGDVVWTRATSEEEIEKLRGESRRRKRLWDCETIINNGHITNRIDIVVLGDGYTNAEMAKYHDNVDTLINYLFSIVPPYKEYAKYFNVHRVDVISEESGIDSGCPSPSAVVNTALDGGYSGRLLHINTSKVWAAAESAPDYDLILVLANCWVYGGAGYWQGIAVSYNGYSMNRVMAHEMGHAFGWLLDEYDSPGGTPANGVNCDDSPTHPIWEVWVGTEGVGFWWGCCYDPTGHGRPTYNSCMMRRLLDKYCAVCREQLVKRIYGFNIATLIDSAYPNSDSVAIGVNDTLQLKIDKLTAPTTEVNWLVNGSSQGVTTDSFLFVAPDTAGKFEVKVTVKDTTKWVRRDPPPLLVNGSERNWSVTVTTAPPGVSASFDVPLVFSLSQSQPNPFNRITHIRYALPEKGKVKLVVYNLAGQRVRTLIDKRDKPGYKAVIWDGTDDYGKLVGNSIYFCRLESNGKVLTCKMVLVK